MEVFSKEVDNKPTLLIPIGDVQYGTEGCQWEKFHSWIGEILRLEDDYQLLFCGMGDFIDALRPTERGDYPRSSEHIRTGLEDKVELDTEALMTILAPTVGKWLFTLRGHHFYQYHDGTTSDSRFAEKLGCMFGGDSVFGSINFKGGEKYTLFARHGQGSASTTASAITRLRNQMIGNTADLNLRGHHHRKGKEEMPVIDLVGRQRPKALTRNRIGLLTGGWLEGYIEGRIEDGQPHGTYAEKAGLNPLDAGGVRVWLIPQSAGLSVEVIM